MSALAAIIGHDARLAMRRGTDTLGAVGFFVLAAVLFPFGIGTEPELLSRAASGVIWVTALLAAMMALDRLFAGDYEDGTLDHLMLADVPLELIVLAKALAHWLTTGVLLLLAAPVLALVYNLPGAAVGPLVVSMAVGTPTLSLVGGIGAALILGARRGGVLLALLVLPLYIPVLIFGAGAIDGAIAGRDVAPQIMILAGFLLAALALAPWATAAALRQAIE